jgi:ATP-dependent Clp protease ATP-binding subunit ClpB
MIIEKFTMKAQDALEHACRLAVKKEHQFVTAWHLFSSLLEQEESPARRYLSQAGAHLDTLEARIGSHLLTQPKALVNAQQTPINRELEKIFIHAQEAASRAEDKYIGINHLLLGMLENGEILSALTEAGVKEEECITILKEAPKSRFKEGETAPGEFEYLARYTTDLTEAARKGELDPVIGRDSEIRMAIQVLSRRLKNNPIIIGEPGVGKTAIAEGLAQRIVQGDVPDDLRPVSILNLDMGQLLAGAKFRGELRFREAKSAAWVPRRLRSTGNISKETVP